MPHKEKEIKEELIKKGILASPKRFIFPVIVVVLAILVSTATFYYLWLKDKNESPKSELNNIPSNKDQEKTEKIEYEDPFTKNNTEGWQKKEFKNLGLSFSIPQEMNVGETTEDNIPTLNIQDYPIGAPPPETYFKMQIVKMESNNPASDIKKTKEELYYPEVKTLGSYTFTQGISLDRKLVSLIYENGIYLKITTAPRNENNEKLTDDILSTIVIK